MIGEDDLGWRGAWRQVGLWVPIPFVSFLAERRAGGRLDPLTLLRAAFLRFVIGVALIGLYVPFIEVTAASGPTGAFAGLVVLSGVASVLIPRRIEQPLDCSSEPKLVGTYRVRFFLRAAFAGATPLLGFVGFVVTGSAWLYPLALILSAGAFGRLAPTAPNLVANSTPSIRQGAVARSWRR